MHLEMSRFFEYRLLNLTDLKPVNKTKTKVAIKCAEAVPSRCHRSLIADAEIAWGMIGLGYCEQDTHSPS